MKQKIHPIAGALAFFIIAGFWFSTVAVELFGTEAQVIAVKSSIPWGFLVLVPAMAAVGGSGFSLAGKRRGGVLGAKARRMPIIAANGVLILIPAALFLAAKAKSGEFDSTFYLVQTLELFAGATNLTLLGMSMRDGLRLKGRLRRKAKV
ncbi:hypothetical protein [Shimia sediminis]|uniref:hypothetical protein n=1 Tax=Shimia sediminis TaxID=2497945 RepID=UPI000F8D4329|nr:hypothetical protein [Shimia sediminis]